MSIYLVLAFVHLQIRLILQSSERFDVAPDALPASSASSTSPKATVTATATEFHIFIANSVTVSICISKKPKKKTWKKNATKEYVPADMNYNTQYPIGAVQYTISFPNAARRHHYKLSNGKFKHCITTNYNIEFRQPPQIGYCLVYFWIQHSAEMATATRYPWRQRAVIVSVATCDTHTHTISHTYASMNQCGSFKHLIYVFVRLTQWTHIAGPIEDSCLLLQRWPFKLFRNVIVAFEKIVKSENSWGRLQWWVKLKKKSSSIILIAS